MFTWLRKKYIITTSWYYIFDCIVAMILGFIICFTILKVFRF